MGLSPIRGRFHTHAQLWLHAGKTKTPFELTQHIFSSVAPPLPSIAIADTATHMQRALHSPTTCCSTRRLASANKTAFAMSAASAKITSTRLLD